MMVCVGVLAGVGVGVGVGKRCVRCVCCFPRLSRAKKDQPFPAQAPSCHLIENAQGPQTVCAACPLLISSSFQQYPVLLAYTGTEENLRPSVVASG